MKKNTNSCWKKLLTLTFLVASQASTAAVDIFPNIYFSSDKIRGECVIGLQNEPYLAMNADCKTVTATPAGAATLAIEPISAFQFDQYPHDEYTTYTWGTVWEGTPDSTHMYCQVFGSNLPGESPIIQLGDANGSEEVEGTLRCKISPEFLKVYTVENCIGSFNIVIGLPSIIPGLHLSYSFATSGATCFPVTVDPRP